MFRKEKAEREMEAELRFHLEMQVEENIRQGMPPESARAEALKSFGGVEKTKDECRDERRGSFLETVLQDMRYGLRTLRRSPGFAAAAILTLALGIGANTAIFSVVHGVLLQSLPYGGGERLVRLMPQGAPGAEVEDSGFSPKEVADYRSMNRTLAGVVEHHSMWFVLLGRKEPERVQTSVVSANFFDIMGVRPLLGRTFVPGDEGPGADAVLVLSNDYWQRSFGGDAAVVGRVFRMNDRPHTVVGVLPPIPEYPAEADVYMPVSACPFRNDPHVVEDRNARMLAVFARLKEGVTIKEGQADLATISGRLRQEYPDAYPSSIRFSATALSLRDVLTRQARPTFLILLATVGLVLLIACANVANLTLARLIRREREMALRSALGAGRGRLKRQLLTESTVLALTGGVLGIFLARASLDLLMTFAGRFTPRAAEISIDGPVLLFSFAVSLLTGIALGLIPAVSQGKSLVSALQGGSDRSTLGPGRHRVRSLLIVAQVAVSFMLLIGAGLMVRTLIHLQRVDAGFQAERVLTMRIDLNFSKYMGVEPRRAFHEHLLQKIEAAPGVLSAAISADFPLNEGGGPNTGGFQIEGRPAPAASQLLPQADFQRTSPDYFKTIGIPLLKGRGFTRADRPGALRVALVNRRLARRHWRDGDPLGKRISFDRGENWITVVGIVGDVKQYGLDADPTDQLYLPVLQSPPLSATFLIRAVADPLALSRLARETIHQIDPEQPVDRFRTLEQVRSLSLSSPRLTTVLLGLFAVLALVITATGITGVIAFSVSERTREFGIRLALGAEPGGVLRMVLRQGMALVLVGLSIGLAGSLFLTRLMSGLLVGIPPTDPLTFLLVSLLLLAVAAAACFVPARRATDVEPLVALRST